MRIVIPEAHWNRLGPRKCEKPDCTTATREGKPFCTDHVDLNPYARSVMDELQKREEDDDKASKSVETPRKRRLVNTAGVTAVELLQNVADHGPRTKERLCRELNIDRQVLDGYVDALKKEGKITLALSRRGSEVVGLAG